MLACRGEDGAAASAYTVQLMSLHMLDAHCGAHSARVAWIVWKEKHNTRERAAEARCKSGVCVQRAEMISERREGGGGCRDSAYESPKKL